MSRYEPEFDNGMVQFEMDMRREDERQLAIDEAIYRKDIALRERAIQAEEEKAKALLEIGNAIRSLADAIRFIK